MGKIDKIKIKSFKSFKGATIPISSGYTTVVGPNGSGKSNLIDSICFALGATSMKTLRADRLVDLVHYESADGTAEVAVDLRDGKETTAISRSIDKKGNSVFRVNGKRTTKFQIDEMLSKFHIRGEGHNIIMQGDVERFIKMTPLQRRSIIDEISGIAEYEAKKTESMRELEKVEAKIREAGIILGERTGYLRVLEKEKEEAERYRDLTQERRECKATILKRELHNVEKAYEKALEFVSSTTSQIDELSKRRGRLEADISELQEKSEKLGKEILEESDKKQTGIRKEIEGVRSSIVVLEGNLETSKPLTEKSSAKREGLLKKISDLGNQVAEKEKEFERLSAEIEDSAEKVKKKGEELQALLSKTADKQLEQAYKQVEELNASIEEKKEKIYSLDSELKSMSERVTLKKASLGTKDNEVKQFKEREEEMLNKAREIETRLTEKRTGHEKHCKELEKLYDDEKTDQKRFEDLESKLAENRERLSRLSSKVSVMKSIAGQTRAVEAVLAEKDKELNGILGTVGSLCTYDSQYATAIETAAGPRMFYIITRTADNATHAVDYLKRKKLGRATFIPLDTIKPHGRDGAEEALKDSGAIELAIKLIKFDAELDKALRYVFGNTVVVNDINTAKRIGIGKVRMVTKDGDLCEASGIITGGFSKRGVSQAELRELEELRKTVADFETQRGGIIGHIRELREKQDTARDARSDTELKIKEDEITLKEWRRRIDEYTESMKSGETASLSMLKEINGLEETLSLKTEAKESLEGELSELIQKRLQTREIFEKPEVKGIDEDIRKLQEELEGLKEARSDLDVKNKTLRHEIDRVLITTRQNLEQEAEELKKDVSELEEKIEATTRERNGLIKVLKEKEVKERELATSMTDLYNEKNATDAEMREKSEKIGEIERKRERLREDMNEKNIEKARFETRYHDLKNEWEKMKDAPLRDSPILELRKRLADLEEIIINFGNVNMKAIEMYERSRRELDEIQEKSKKLNEEQESILNMVSEIENKKLTSFMETFNALNRNFNKYFTEFYPEEGSHAGLKLQNPEKPLESGLILEAKPAGKTLKLIDALSGGEKAVTALAFLFAIQAYNPSPFYILDEVDASLDNENSERVAKMLKKFSKELQFIIITHNRAVLRKSDQIVGVHMGKDGSSVIEVDLKDYHPAAATAA